MSKSLITLTDKHDVFLNHHQILKTFEINIEVIMITA